MRYTPNDVLYVNGSELFSILHILKKHEACNCGQLHDALKKIALSISFVERKTRIEIDNKWIEENL